MPDFWSTHRALDDADLNTFQLRLLFHVWRVGTCWKSQRALARACHMSLGQVNRVRRWLLQEGWLEELVLEDGRAAVQLCHSKLEALIEPTAATNGRSGEARSPSGREHPRSPGKPSRSTQERPRSGDEHGPPREPNRSPGEPPGSGDEQRSPDEPSRSPRERPRSRDERPRSPNEQPRSLDERPRSPDEPKKTTLRKQLEEKPREEVRGRPIALPAAWVAFFRANQIPPPKSRQEFDEVLHPATLTWLQATSTWPGYANLPYLAGELGRSPDSQALRRAWTLWRASRNKPGNLVGVIDWYHELLKDPAWTPAARFWSKRNGRRAAEPAGFAAIRDYLGALRD